MHFFKMVTLWVVAISAFGQSSQTVPVPEYYGIYAVVDGRLLQLDSQQVRPGKFVNVPLGQRNGVGNILQGQTVASSRVAEIANVGPDLKIIVFSQPSGLRSPLDVAQSLHLESFVFIRNVTVNTGWPNNVRRSGVENGWDSGDAPELLGMSQGDRSKLLEFQIRPMPGRSDMVIAELPQHLSPGVYRLSIGQQNPLFGGRGFLFAVGPTAEGEALNCVDALVTYSMNISNSKYSKCSGDQAPPTTRMQASPPEMSGSALETFDGATRGQAYGITYRGGAVFSRTAESRIEYPGGIPNQGTLEWSLKIDDAYTFSNFVLHPHENCAVVFATDAEGGDVTWPGATKLSVCRNGDLMLDMAQAKYNDMPHQLLKVAGSQFRFGEWHSLGVSYGSNGQAIMLDGVLVGTAPGNRQMLGAAGTHESPADVPTIGETVSHYWQHRQYSGGFDGTVSRFRVSTKQDDWVLATQAVSAAGSNPITNLQESNSGGSCPSPQDAGYRLQLDAQHIYRVLHLGLPSPQTPSVFVDSRGLAPPDLITLRRLETAAWVHDWIISENGPSAVNYRRHPTDSEMIQSLLQTSIALRAYQQAQDILVRGSIDLFAAVLSDGTTTIVPLKKALEAAKPDPKSLLLALSYGGMLRSSDEYAQIEYTLSNLHGTTYDVSTMEKIYSSYLDAWAFSQTFRPILVTTEPTRWTDLAQQAMWSTGTEALYVMDRLPAAITASAVVDAFQEVQSAKDTASLYGQWVQGLKFSHAYAAATHRLIDRWARTAQACSSMPAKSVNANTFGTPQTFASSTVAMPPAPEQVLVAGFQVLNRQTFLVPMFGYDGKVFRFIPNDFPDEPGSSSPNRDLWPNGRGEWSGNRANPNNAHVRQLIDKSVLSKVKLFNIYRKGRRVGLFTVEQIALVGPFGQAVAEGTADGFTPQFEDIAISVDRDQSRSKLSDATVRSLLRSVNKGGESTNTFKASVDIRGTGVPEVILLNGTELTLYDIQDNSLRMLGARGWEMGFELPVAGP